MSTTEELEIIAKKCRDNAMVMAEACGSGHLGGSFSVMDVLVALYFKVMKDDDVLVLSKAHCSEALYAVLCEKGIVKRDELVAFGEWGSRLQCHAEHATIPEIVFSGGSLGQGLSFACGIAEARKRKNKSGRVFCVIGDGECHEGQIWEAAMFAGHHKLSNLFVILDSNGYSSSSSPRCIESILSIQPIDSKWKAFNWDTQWLTDGNNINYLLGFLMWDEMYFGNKPRCFIVCTVKGKGNSVLEKSHCHLVYGKELEEAVKEWKNAT